MNSDGNLATAAESGQGRALRRNCEARVGVVEEGTAASVSTSPLRISMASALAGGRTKILRIETLADPIGFAETVESGGGEQNRVHLALGQLAQARVDVAAKLDGLNVGRKAFNCARRRWLLVPTRAPAAARRGSRA
jgi:hypothetical protein